MFSGWDWSWRNFALTITVVVMGVLVAHHDWRLFVRIAAAGIVVWVIYDHVNSWQIQRGINRRASLARDAWHGETQ